MSVAIAFLDASVLYPAPLRDLLLELAVSDLFRAKWSQTVHDEWIRALLRDRPDLTAKRLERTRRLMDAHVRDAVVSGFEYLVPSIQLPDPDDRHVVAAAIQAGADLVVTANVRDFPVATLARHHLTAEHPDVFLTSLCRRVPVPFLQAVQRVRARLRNPPVSRRKHLAVLRRLLKNEPLVGRDDAFDIVRSRPHGHVAAALGTLRKLRLDRTIAGADSPERRRALALIVARILDPGSKLATARGLAEATARDSLAETLGLEDCGEDDLYGAMDWLLERQNAIERRLAKRHLEDGALVLYDLTSVWLEGRHCPLARRGYSRDGKKGKLQIEFGLLCDAQRVAEAAVFCHDELGIGHLQDQHHLTFHQPVLGQCLPLIRVYVGCALQLFGDAAYVDLVKVHLEFPKVTFLRYDDLESPTSVLVERIKVDLARLRVDYIDHSATGERQSLEYSARDYDQTVVGQSAVLILASGFIVWRIAPCASDSIRATSTSIPFLLRGLEAKMRIAVGQSESLTRTSRRG